METVAALFSAIGRGVGQFADLTFMALGGTGGTFTSPSPMAHDAERDMSCVAVNAFGFADTESGMSGVTVDLVECDPLTGRLNTWGSGFLDPIGQWELAHEKWMCDDVDGFKSSIATSLE